MCLRIQKTLLHVQIRNPLNAKAEFFCRRNATNAPVGATAISMKEYANLPEGIRQNLFPLQNKRPGFTLFSELWV
jgi:hypothetical protein